MEQCLAVRAQHRDVLAVDDALDRFVAIAVVGDHRAAQFGGAFGLAPQLDHGFGFGQAQARFVREDGFQAALDERAHFLGAEPRRAAHIVDGPRGLRSQPGRFCDASGVECRAFQECLGFRRADDRRRDAAQGDPRTGNVLVFVHRQHDGDIRHGNRQNAAQAQLEIHPTLIRVQRRKHHVGDHLIRFHHRAADAGVVIGDGYCPVAARAAQAHARPQRTQGRDRIVGGRRGDEVAHDGATVA